MSIFTLAFWRAALERAIKSAAQGALVAGIGAAGFDALHADYQTIGGLALGMALASVLTSVASDALTNGNGPSLTDAEVLPKSSHPHGQGERGLTTLGVLLLVVLVVVVVVLLTGQV